MTVQFMESADLESQRMDMDKAKKNILKSKTVWGVIIAALPTLLEMGQSDVLLIKNVGDAVITLAGAALAIYGRYAAGGVKLY